MIREYYRAHSRQVIKTACKTLAGRLQVLSLPCPTSPQRELSPARLLVPPPASSGSAEQSQSKGVCAGEQHSPHPLPVAVTPSHLVMGSSPHDRNPSFLSQYIPPIPGSYTDQQFLP